MAVKVRFDRGAWWLFVHYNGRRWKKRVGSEREAAKEAAKELQRRIASGDIDGPIAPLVALPFDAMLRDWHTRYSVTFKPRYAESSGDLIRNHLAPFFEGRDVRSLTENDLLDYTRAKLGDDYAPATILNGLSIVRRVLGLAVREGLIQRNPALGCGRLIARVARTTAAEVHAVESWTRGEVETLLRLAAEHERRVAPILRFLVSTGARRGEALGLRWEDVDFDRSRITIRRALTKGVLVTPKSGKARVVAMPPSLAEALFDLLATRRQECLHRGWPELPAWVFASEAGTPLDEGNLTRAWHRVRRRAQKDGVRPFKLHAARHTFASLALAAGRSIRWVADQLGHQNPELTLRTYAHALPVDEADLAFADFGAPARTPTTENAPQAHPALASALEARRAIGLTIRRPFGILERETGIEPATLGLGSRCSTS